MIDAHKIPSVAAEFMNHDHLEAAELINRATALLESKESDSNRLSIDQALAALLDHTRTHFAAEESRMRDSGFPPYDVHKSEHERVLVEMMGEIEAWHAEADTGRLTTYLLGTLPEWFFHHIQTMDTVTAYFLERNGLDRKSA